MKQTRLNSVIVKGKTVGGVETGKWFGKHNADVESFASGLHAASIRL